MNLSTLGLGRSGLQGLFTSIAWPLSEPNPIFVLRGLEVEGVRSSAVESASGKRGLSKPLFEATQ